MKINTLPLKTQFGQDVSIILRKNTYQSNNRLYIGMLALIDGEVEPWSTLTVNLVDAPCTDINTCSYVDINNNGSSILKFITDNNLGEVTGVMARSGFCIYPEVKFNLEEINKYCHQ